MIDLVSSFDLSLGRSPSSIFCMLSTYSMLYQCTTYTRTLTLIQDERRDACASNWLLESFALFC